MMVQNVTMENAKWILCGVCVDNCPEEGVIKYSWRQRK